LLDRNPDMLRRAPFDQLLEAFSSSDPTPGGGSAAALAGAVGASLLAMVAGLPKTRHGTEEDRRALDAARTILIAERDRLSELVDLDTAAYDRVVAAFRLPKATEEEKATRSAAVQAALRGATETPLSVMRACEAVIRAGDAVATSGNPSASSDVQVGFELALAGLRGARLNVEINLGSVKDTAFVGAVREEVARLVRDADSGVTRARSHAG
jgi:formiminotetrahydrofolate cyclodeaminase